MTIRCGISILAIAAVTGFAVAQTPPTTPGSQRDAITEPGTPPAPSPSLNFQLTNAQRATIANAVRRDGGKPASRVGFAASVGAAVPPQIELYILPDAALAAVPDAKIVKYTMVQNQIVLVDPTTMRVVDVIPASPAAP
jgi:uncharacterized protein DUF1236